MQGNLYIKFKRRGCKQGKIKTTSLHDSQTVFVGTCIVFAHFCFMFALSLEVSMWVGKINSLEFFRDGTVLSYPTPPVQKTWFTLSKALPFSIFEIVTWFSKANKAEVLWVLLFSGRDLLKAAPRISMGQCGWKEIIWPTLFPETNSLGAQEGSFVGTFSTPGRAFCSFLFPFLLFWSLIQFSHSFQKSTSVELLKEVAEILSRNSCTWTEWFPPC